VNSRQYSLYIIRCGDDSLYTGIAVDVEKRLQEHRAGSTGAKYLRGRGPLQVVFRREVGDRATATRLEYRVKRLDRSGKEALVAGRLALDDLQYAPGQASGGSGPNSSNGLPNSGQ
jgi:putative endonuclease